MNNEHVYVTVQQDEDGYPPVAVEELHVERVGRAVARVAVTPTFVRGIARGDLLEVVGVEGEDGLWVRDVVEYSGRGVARVIPMGAKEQEVVSRLARHGLDGRITEYGLVVIDVPNGFDGAALAELLGAGRADGAWDYEISVFPGGAGAAT